MAAIATYIIFVFDSVFKQGFVQDKAACAHESFCLLGSLTHKQVVHFFVYLWIIQKSGDALFRIIVSALRIPKEPNRSSERNPTNMV